MDENLWRYLLVGALAYNAVAGFGYRVYRLTRGGPMNDVMGQALLGVILAALAVAVATGQEWSRWVAFAYALLFGIVVMPVWTLGVLIPSSPRAIDHAYAVTYWAALGSIAAAAILV